MTLQIVREVALRCPEHVALLFDSAVQIIGRSTTAHRHDILVAASAAVTLPPPPAGPAGAAVYQRDGRAARSNALRAQPVPWRRAI